MKREFLTKELGLSKEITDKIMAQYGESVNSLKSENERLQNENEDFKSKLLEVEKTSARAGELESKNAELSESIEKLTSELKSSKIDGAVSAKLIGAGAKNLKAVSALIDKSKVCIEDGELSGLDEQIEAVKNECGYLFYGENQSSGMRHTSSQNTVDGFTSYARAGAKLN